MTDDGERRTVDGRGLAEFERRGSRFVGRVAPAGTVEVARGFVDAVAEKHDDATHNVSAYRVRADTVRERYDDAGEPSGSAGKPALGVLRHEDVEDVVAVVTRYHGGTKLGYGGLVSAYSDATKRALDDAGVVERRPRETVRVEVGYDDVGAVEAVLGSRDADYDAEYTGTVVYEVRTPDADGLEELIMSATSGRAGVSRPDDASD